MKRSPLKFPSTWTGMEHGPFGSMSAHAPCGRLTAGRPPGRRSPGIVPDPDLDVPSGRAGRGPGSATGACGGTAPRHRDDLREQLRPGRAVRPGRRPGGCRRVATGPGSPASASASRIARTWFVGRQYQSIAARGSTSSRDIGPFLADARRAAPRRGRVLLEAFASCCTRARCQVQPIPGQLRDRDERGSLVLRSCPAAGLRKGGDPSLASVVGDPREEHEIVVPAGDLERIELERARGGRRPTGHTDRPRSATSAAARGSGAARGIAARPRD